MTRLGVRGSGPAVLRLGPSVSFRFPRRAVSLSAALVALIAASGALSLSLGDFPIPVSKVAPAALGLGDPDVRFVVHTLRLPRLLTAALVGTAYGVSGAVFQALARNPLASPDLVGVNAGAAVGALAVIVLLAGTGTAVSLAAMAGAVATAAAVYLLAYRRGITGYRLILVGIGVTAVLTSATSWLLTRADVFDAQRAAVWLAGSLNGAGWAQVRPLAVVAAVLVPVSMALSRPLRLLLLGDDAARGLGVRVERSRAALVLAGVLLAAAATSAAGPVAFVALVAPQIGRRLVRAGDPALGTAGLTGAAVVVLADLLARRLFAPIELPVGVVTAVVGAPYLLWLLGRAGREGMAG